MPAPLISVLRAVLASFRCHSSAQLVREGGLRALDSVAITRALCGALGVVPWRDWGLVLCPPLADAVAADHTSFLPLLPSFISSVTLQPHLCDPHLSHVPYRCSVCKMS